MIDVLKLVSEQDRRTSPGLAQLSRDDIRCIWADVSAFIQRQITLEKGVHLTGLGTFTFSQQKLDIGNRFTLIQRPVFILAGRLIQSLGLKQNRPLAAVTNIPVVQLNLAAVSQDSPFSRDVVEACVRETLLKLYRTLASETNVLLPLEGVGVLYFRSNKVQMKFNKDFIQAVDGSGRLLLAFSKRPGSSVSLISGAPSRLQRPRTTNTVTLPAVCAPHCTGSNQDGIQDGRRSPPASHGAGTRAEVLQQSESKSNQTLLETVGRSKEPNPDPPTEATDNDESGSRMRPSTSDSLQRTPKLEERLISATCSDHTRAGQEICYLCMQRAQRNVPVYVREQQEAEQKTQEKLLLLEEQQRDKKYLEEQQVKLNEQREHAKQVATFNLRLSEKKEKPHLPLHVNSFLFPARQLTPPRRIQQHHYMNDLESQIGNRRRHEAEEQQSRVVTERLEQVQLGQELDLQKAQQLQRKRERTQHYKNALDAQVEEKTSVKPPECRPDESQSRRCRTATEDVASRERAQQVFQVNFSAATQRKKEELQSRQQEVEKESEMLRHNKMELILDRINHFEKTRDVSKSLENEWRRSVKLKRSRDEEERRFLRSAGQLLVDKLAEYRRCCQCKRKTTNSGETNIWRDSRYLSGSQFMI